MINQSRQAKSLASTPTSTTKKVARIGADLEMDMGAQEREEHQAAEGDTTVVLNKISCP
jgi:hypothetical protein